MMITMDKWQALRESITTMLDNTARGTAYGDGQAWAFSLVLDEMTTIDAQPPVRKAVIARRDMKPTVEAASRYLPGNYHVTGWTDDLIMIEGSDDAGWTLDDYVIPRLASGLITCREVSIP